MPVMSRADIRPNRRGIPQLSRHWEAADPWASMLIIHGMGEHSGRWERTGSIFADAGIEVWAFDLIGMGGSGGDRGHVESWSMYTDDVADHLTPVFVSGRPSVLMGHSFGGLIAITYARSLNRQPDYLVLSSPSLAYSPPIWQRPLATFLNKVMPKLAVPNKFDVHRLSRDPAVGEAYQADPLNNFRTTPHLGMLFLEQMEKAGSRLSEIRQPTLVIHGGQDEIVPPSGTVEIGQLPNVDRKVYPHLRHETLNEPEGPEVAADIVAWLRDQVQPAG